jgi:dephospho-CoA kinase
VHIDCDRLAWDTYRPGGPAYLRILARFGEEILAEDGGVDRKKLGTRVFSDPQAKADLEAIVHPLVMESLREVLARARKKGARLALVEGALLLASPHVDRNLFDLFLWLSVPAEVRRARLRAAGWPEEALRQRIQAQEELSPPSLPNVLLVDGQGSPPVVAERVLQTIHSYFGEEAPSS